jgi:hypothetical protein
MNYIQVPNGFLRFNLLIPNHGTSVDYKIRRLKNIYIKSEKINNVFVKRFYDIWHIMPDRAFAFVSYNIFIG